MYYTAYFNLNQDNEWFLHESWQIDGFFFQTYDGIWAAALAIQYVAKRKEQFLERFEYRVKDWENIFLEALKNTSFEGVTVSSRIRMHSIYTRRTWISSISLLFPFPPHFFVCFQGPVRFYNNERRANILLKQFQAHREVKIGEFNSMENKLMFESGEKMKWVSFVGPF